MHHNTRDHVLMQHEELGLRHFLADDLDALFELESDGFLKEYVGGPVTKPRGQWLKDAATLVQVEYQFALEHLPTGGFAGRVTLGHYHSKDCREVQVILAKPYVGKLLGRVACQLACSYAFETLSATSVVGVVDPRHTASLNLVAALGFRETLPQIDASGSVTKRVFELARGA